MSDRGTVVFACRKCGKPITRSSARRGELFSCAGCEHVQKTPGIASQAQATPSQIDQIRRAHRWHLIGLVAAPVVVVIAIALTPSAWELADQYRAAQDYEKAGLLRVAPGLLALVGMFFLLCAELGSLECLGGRSSTSFILFILTWPVWVVRSILTYFRIRSHIERLSRLGPRA